MLAKVLQLFYEFRRDKGYDFLNNQDNVNEVNFNGNDLKVVDTSKLDVTNIGLDDNVTLTNLTSGDTVFGHAAKYRDDDGYGNAPSKWTYDYTLRAEQDGGEVNFHADEADGDDFLVLRGNSGENGIETSDFGTLNLTGKGDVRFSNDSDSLNSKGASQSQDGQATTINAADYEGNLSFTAGENVEKITLGGGEDTLTFAAGKSDFDDTDVITGFGSEDTIELTKTTGDDDKVSEYMASEEETLKDELVAAAKSDVDGAWFEHGDNTYVVQNDGNEDTAAALDTVIKLTGVDLGLTEDNFDIATA